MTVSFVLTVIFISVMLYAPAYLLLRSAGCHKDFAVSLAPPLGVAIVGLFGALYEKAGIRANAFDMMAIPLLVAVAVFVVSRIVAKRRGAELDDGYPDIDVRAVAVYILVGVALGSLIYLRRLPMLDTPIQAWDYPHHLNGVKAFVDTGVVSATHTMPYLSNVALDPFIESIGFYPSGWLAVCAVAVMGPAINAALAINAANFVFSFIVFPISMCVALKRLVPESVHAPLIGAVACLSLTIFPWQLLVWGPIFPNLAAFAVLPGLIAGTILFFDEPRPIHAAIWAIACIGTALLHANVVFSLGVFMIPYIVHLIREHRCQLSLGKLRIGPAGICVLFLIACALIWTAIYRLPFLTYIRHTIWPSYASVSQALMNILMLTYVEGFPPSAPVTFVAALFTLIGIVAAFRDPKRRWIVGSYGLAAALMMVTQIVPEDALLRRFCIGFWYCDPQRVAAMTTIFAIPLLVIGFFVVFDRVRACACRAHGERRGTLYAVAGTTLLYAALVFYPTFNVPGYGTVYMPFSYVRGMIVSGYTENGTLDKSEREFLAQVKGIVGDDVVINTPHDGSVLAYGLDGIDCYYRYFNGYGDGQETPDGELIREHLYQMDSDSRVRDAVRAIDAKYVMILDKRPGAPIFPGAFYDDAMWVGITRINDRTPGFTPVLRKGAMRLYRIDLP